MNIGLEKLDPASNFRYLQFKASPGPAVRQAKIVYLHGAGEFGTDINSVCNYGLPSLLRNEQVELNCDVVCPQMDHDEQWNIDRLQELLSSLENQNQEIILAGFSRGGRAVCDFVAQYGSTISMAIIIAGRGLVKIATKLESLEIVSILGMDDPWPDMELFLKDAELHRANVTDIRLHGKGHFISEEVFLHGELPKILSTHEVVIDKKIEL